MAIETKDLVIYKSERLTDNSDGGGKYSGVVVQDGISNNLFNDVSKHHPTTHLQFLHACPNTSETTLVQPPNLYR